MTEAHQQDEAVSDEVLSKRAAAQFRDQLIINIDGKNVLRPAKLNANTALALLFKVIAHEKLDGTIGLHRHRPHLHGWMEMRRVVEAEPFGEEYEMVCKYDEVTIRTLIQACVEALESVDDG